MNFQELLDAYDDLVDYLSSGREALVTHPMKTVAKEHCDAAFCQMLIMMVVTCIDEVVLKGLLGKKGRRARVLAPYFVEQTSRGRVSNQQRVQGLCEAFHREGFVVDDEVFSDYLAIKYLRNMLVHAREPLEHEMTFILQRGFPANPRALSHDHWRRVMSVLENVTSYAFALGIVSSPTRLPKVSGEPAREDLGIIRRQDLPRVFRSNLERIDSALREAEGAGSEDTAQKEAALRELAHEALYSWRQYWDLTFGSQRISEGDILGGIEVFRSLHERRIYPTGPFVPWPEEVPAGVTRDEFERFVHEGLGLKGYEPLRLQEIDLAMRIGHKVYDLARGLPAFETLVGSLALVEQVKTAEYLEEAKRSLAAAELADYWYSYVAHRSPPDFERWSTRRAALGTQKKE